MRYMKKKILIFDLDGVLFDSGKIVSDHFMDLFPAMTEEIMQEILLGNFHEGIEKFKLTNTERVQNKELVMSIKR